LKEVYLNIFNPLMPELLVNRSAQRCLPRMFTGDFNFKGLTALRLYEFFSVKGLGSVLQVS
jgi:hypothetical protein